MVLRHVVVATDDSPAGCSAVRAGLDLAERACARLTVMRVAGVVVGSECAAGGLERLQRWVEAELKSDTTVPVELGIAFGLAGIEICRFAEQRGADVLVLGRKHRSAVARLLVGDTADAVVRRSRVPCLFVEEGALPMSRLLVALDGSDRGLRVYGSARGFARSIGADVTVVTVEHSDAPPAVERISPLPLTRSSRLQHELEARATMTEGPAARETAVSIRQGRPVHEILAEIAECGADALAFGCHRGGRSGILDSGGIARHLLHNAPVSVLTIPL